MPKVATLNEKFVTEFADHLLTMEAGEESDDYFATKREDLLLSFASLTIFQKGDFLMKIATDQAKFFSGGTPDGNKLLIDLLQIFLDKSDPRYEPMKILEEFFTKLFNNRSNDYDDDRFWEEPVQNFLKSFTSASKDLKVCFLTSLTSGEKTDKMICKIFKICEPMDLTEKQVLHLTFISGSRMVSQIPSFSCNVCKQHTVDLNNLKTLDQHHCLFPKFNCAKCKKSFTPLEPRQKYCFKCLENYKPRTPIGKQINKVRKHQEQLIRVDNFKCFRYSLIQEIEKNQRSIPLSSIFDTPSGQLEGTILPLLKTRLTETATDQQLVHLIQTKIKINQEIMFILYQQSFFCYHCVAESLYPTPSILSQVHKVRARCEKCEQLFCDKHSSWNENLCKVCHSDSKNEKLLGSYLNAVNNVNKKALTPTEPTKPTKAPRKAPRKARQPMRTFKQYVPYPRSHRIFRKI